MTEEDYIKATNRVKISAALNLVRDCVGGDEYGVSELAISELEQKLVDIERDLFSSYSIEAQS